MYCRWRIKRGCLGWTPLIGLTPEHYCTYQKLGPVFPTGIFKLLLKGFQAVSILIYVVYVVFLDRCIVCYNLIYDFWVGLPLWYLQTFLATDITQLYTSKMHTNNIKVMSSNPVHGEVYSMQHYVIKFVCDLRQVGCFSRYSGFLPQ